MSDDPDTLDLRNPVIVRLPPQIVRLQEAINAEPELAARLQAECNTFEDVIACLCAQYSIILNDTYTGEDVLRICELLTDRLRNEFVPRIVLTPGQSIH